MSGDLVRKKHMRQFTGLQRYSWPVAWAILFFYIATIAVAMFAGHVILSSGLSVGTISAAVVIALLIATRLRGINNIVHECSHGSFAAQRKHNMLIGKFSIAMILGCFHDYRIEHLSHHKYLGDYSKDLDFGRIEELHLESPLTAQNLKRHMLLPFIGKHLPYYLGSNFSMRDGPFFLALKMVLIAGAFFLAYFAPWTAVFFVLLPYGLFLPTLNYWTDCLDHAGLFAADDELDASRNVLAPRWIRRIFFPREDCFHLVHHLFPQVPSRHLEATHQVLSEDPEYRARPHAVVPAHQRFIPTLRPEGRRAEGEVDNRV